MINEIVCFQAIEFQGLWWGWSYGIGAYHH